jgi:hypothetical protein
VEYEPITPAPGGPAIPVDTVATGPDYTALKSWIPGGTVDQYEWHKLGAQGLTESNRFVYLDPGPVSTSVAMSAHLVVGFSPMCLTVHGTRLTSSGPFVNENVSATVCGYGSFPFGDLGITDATLAPMIALVRSGTGGMVEVVGHARARSASKDAGAPNLIVHFADEVSGEKLDGLANALRESNRKDAPTAIVVAAKASRISRLPYSETTTYAEDDGQWRKQLGVNSSGAATVIVDPSGKAVWKAEGPVNERELAAALGKLLMKGSPLKPTMLSATARIGLPAPNFLFDHSPGQPLTLRKAGGRKITLVFYNPASEPSVSAVRDAVASAGDKSIVLAVRDGAASPSGEVGSAIVVPDPQRQVAAAYGVTMWPTVFLIDESGIVRSISYGRTTRGEKSRA